MDTASSDLDCYGNLRQPGSISGSEGVTGSVDQYSQPVRLCHSVTISSRDVQILIDGR